MIYIIDTIAKTGKISNLGNYAIGEETGKSLVKIGKIGRVGENLSGGFVWDSGMASVIAV